MILYCKFVQGNNYPTYFSSSGGIIEMRAFQNEFPTIFREDESNETDHSCSSGSGEREDLLVVSK